jgi:hypothetical protein
MRCVRPIVVATSAIFMIAAPVFAANRTLTAQRRPGVPRVDLPSLMLDLGDAMSGEVREGMFQLGNRGNAPLAVTFRPCCDGKCPGDATPFAWSNHFTTPLRPSK